MLILCASPDSSVAIQPGDTQEYSRICIFEIKRLPERDFGRVSLYKYGDVIITAHAQCLCFDRDKKGTVNMLNIQG